LVSLVKKQLLSSDAIAEGLNDGLAHPKTIKRNVMGTQFDMGEETASFTLKAD